MITYKENFMRVKICIALCFEMRIKMKLKKNISTNYTNSYVLSQRLVLLPIDWDEKIYCLQNGSKLYNKVNGYSYANTSMKKKIK